MGQLSAFLVVSLPFRLRDGIYSLLRSMSLLLLRGHGGEFDWTHQYLLILILDLIKINLLPLALIGREILLLHQEWAPTHRFLR